MPELDRPLRLVRPADMLVLDVEVVNLRLSDDANRLERIDSGARALLIVRFPFQHTAEEAFLEFAQSREPATPPPVAALAAGATRLVFAVPDDRPSIDFSVEGLLDWDALVPHLAPNALPSGTSEGPGPAEPAEDQTAIEFPYRLLLSPDSSARWVHRRTHPTGPRVELWHTRLVGASSPVPVRAVGRRPVPDVVRTSLSSRDLDDLVTLTADFRVRPKRWHELGLPFWLWRERMRLAGLLGFDYVPRPLDAERLLLTSLGASVRLRGHWDYPRPDQDPEVLREFGMPTPSLQQYEHIAGLGRDQFVRVVRRGFVHSGHRASIVKVTERRFEPRQLRTEQTSEGAVGIFGATAYLRQYFKIVIQEPEISYDSLAGGFEHGGREMPLRSLRFTTLITPKIDLWRRNVDGALELVDLSALEQQARVEYAATHPNQPIDEVAVAEEVQRKLEAALQQPFWITTGGQDFEFSFAAVDWEGGTVSGSTPLVFVPYEALGDTARVLQTFADGAVTRRRRPLANQKVAVAQPAGGGGAEGATSLATQTMTFTLQSVPQERAVRLPATYRPRWLLAMSAAEVHVEPVERLTGRGAAVAMTFDPDYLAHGLEPSANAGGVFARIPAVDVAFDGSGGGGIARPNAAIDRISSRQGAVSSTFAKPHVTLPDLEALFGSAKLFGSFDLKDILAPIGPVTSQHFNFADLPEAELEVVLAAPGQHVEVPILRTRLLVDGGSPYATETRYLWKPRLEARRLFLFEADSEFVLDARAVTPLDGAKTRSEVRGELRRFGMSFFGVAEVWMTRLAFVAAPEQKPDITAEGLDLRFKGPLEFVNTLREILPSDGFSDPPAIEVTPAGIRAGYTLGIPTVGVGIFSLQNLALSAALSVPFVDRPAGLRFAISDRHRPFLVTVTLFGGGGFFALGVSAEGVDEIEAAIEFGGNVSLNLGVASGGVYVMAGIYFGLTGELSTLTGYLRCGGYLSVLGLITISVEFYLAFTYREKGGGRSEVWGQASVSVCVEVACFSKSVRLSIERRFAGAGGDPSLEDVMDVDDWEHYCLAFAAEDAG